LSTAVGDLEAVEKPLTITATGVAARARTALTQPTGTSTVPEGASIGACPKGGHKVALESRDQRGISKFSPL
jgi:hypothetical protein